MVSICDKNVVNNAVNTVAESLIKEYKSEFFSENNMSVGSNPNALFQHTAMMNHFIHAPEVKNIITEFEYPNLYKRIEENGFITPYEVGNYIKQSMVVESERYISYMYTTDSVNEFRYYANDPFGTGENNPVSYLVLNRSPNEYSIILKDFDYYMSNSFRSDSSRKSFCEMVPTIFEKIERMTNIFNDFRSLMGKVSQKVDKIKNAISGKSLSQLIDVTTAQIEEMFKREMERLKSIYSSNIISTERVRVRVAEKYQRLVDDARDFFTEDNKKSIIERVKAQIQYAIDFFKDPDLEEIQYMIMRFCTLLSSLKDIFDSKMNPIKKIIESYNETQRSLSNASKFRASMASRAGAVRLDDQIIASTRSSLRTELEQNSVAQNGNYNVSRYNPTTTEIDGLTPWNNGNGDHRITFRGGWVSKVGSLGWTGARPQARLLLDKVQHRFGKRLIVNSAYRPPSYNASIGGAKGSQHMNGIAFDITWDGWTGPNSQEAMRFVKIALDCGFEGIGGYSSFIHIDLGGKRDWGTLDGRVYVPQTANRRI